MKFQKTRLMIPVILIIIGTVAALVSGLVENTPKGSMIGATGYGYPWAWRFNVIHQTTQSTYKFGNLAADIAFWGITCFLALAVIDKTLLSHSETQLTKKRNILILLLLIPLGLSMGVIHEAGHALCGMAIGGTLSHMQIGYFTIYPNLAIASQFKLGSVTITGLSTPTQHGFFLLAGSLATNITAWLVGIIINKVDICTRNELYLKTFGSIGLLDLPLYTFLPLLGLRHWILLGNNSPEPLIGARKLGIPDLIFFLLVAVITATLLLVYSKSIREKLHKTIQR